MANAEFVILFTFFTVSLSVCSRMFDWMFFFFVLLSKSQYYGTSLGSNAATFSNLYFGPSVCSRMFDGMV